MIRFDDRKRYAAQNYRTRRITGRDCTESIVINNAFAHVEQMLYLSQWFQNVRLTDLLKHVYGREWVKALKLKHIWSKFILLVNFQK
jgi:hypothetical protein